MSENTNVETNENVGLQAWWVTYGGFIKTMFLEDPEVEVDTDDLDEDKPERTIYVKVNNNHQKAAALSTLLVPEFKNGNITVKVSVVDNSEDMTEINADLLRVVFDKNPIMESIEEVEPFPGAPETATFAVFAKKVFQFWNDDLSDINGNFNGLAEDVSGEIFKQKAGINYCTSNKDANAE